MPSIGEVVGSTNTGRKTIGEVVARSKPFGASTLKVAGYTAIGGGSPDPIHYGTHKGGGVYDITEREAKRRGKTLEQVAQEVAGEGYLVAIRKAGQRGIKSNHLHFVDPKVNPKEARRLQGQMKGGFIIAPPSAQKEKPRLSTSAPKRPGVFSADFVGSEPFVSQTPKPTVDFRQGYAQNVARSVGEVVKGAAQFPIRAGLGALDAARKGPIGVAREQMDPARQLVDQPRGDISEWVRPMGLDEMGQVVRELPGAFVEGIRTAPEQLRTGEVAPLLMSALIAAPFVPKALKTGGRLADTLATGFVDRAVAPKRGLFEAQQAMRPKQGAGRTVGEVVAEKPTMPVEQQVPQTPTTPITIYRGESVYNKGGSYYTPDMESARQYTQSGLDNEIKSSVIDPSKIYKSEPLPLAADEVQFNKAIADAKANGYDAVWFDEGAGEPNSVFVINKKALGKPTTPAPSKPPPVPEKPPVVEGPGVESVAAARAAQQADAAAGAAMEPVRPAGAASGGTLAFKAPGGGVMPRASGTVKPKAEGPVRASDIVKELDQAFAPIRTGRFRQKALGIFKVRENVVRSSKANDLPTISHEVGHALHKLIWPEARTSRGGLGANAFPRKYWGELRPMAYPGAKVRVTEGYAEFIRMYLTDPAQAKARAPEFHDFFTSKLKDYPEVQKVLAKAQADIVKWIEQPEQMRVRGTISTGQPSVPRPLTLDRVYSTWVDELRPLERAESEITGGKPVPTSRSAFKEAWLGRGVAGKAHEWLSNGVTNTKGQKVAKGLREVIRPVVKDLDDFVDYAVSRHGVDVIEAKGAQAMPLDIRDYQAVVDKAPAHYESVLRELVSYQDNLLKELVDSGLIDKEAVVAMRSKWPNHVPLYRVIGDKAGARGMGRGQANVKSPIKRLKGSGRDIINPIESIVKDTYTVLNLAQRNRVMTKLVNLANKSENAGRWVEKVPQDMRPTTFTLEEVLGNTFGLSDTGLALLDAGVDLKAAQTVFKPTGMPAGKENIVRVFRGGKAEYYKLDPELYNAVTAQDVLSSDILTRIISTPASILRAGATLTPEFAIRNPMRDVMSALVYSEYGLTPFDWAKGVFEVVKRGDIYKQWKATGAAHSAMVSLDRNYLQSSMRNIMRQKPSEKIIDLAMHPIDALRALGEVTESATRVAEFEKGVKGGKVSDLNTILDAAIDSRDITIDFSRAGTAGKKVNRAVAFFNATVGGSDKMIRAFRANPARTTMRATAYITVPTVALYMLNRNNPRYQSLPEWQKDLFWIIPTTEDGPMIRIPKPFELGIIFGALPERMLRWLDQNDPHAFDDFARNAGEAAIPSAIPTALVPWVQAVSNKSFSGTPIVPRREQDLPKPLQYGEQTTSLSVLAGRTLNQSPRQIDSLIQGYTGGLGRYAAGGISAGLEAAGAIERAPKPTPTLSSRPVIRGLLVNEYSSPVEVERLYRERGRLQDQKKMADGGLARQLSAKQQERLRVLDTRAKMLSEQRKTVRAVTEAKTIDELRGVLTQNGIPTAGKTINAMKRAALTYLKRREKGIANGSIAAPSKGKSGFPGMPTVPTVSDFLPKLP